jgi:hypothetical protein
MNRVLNKDFVSGSYLNSALVSFSDVFRPASCMQSCNVRESKESILKSYEMFSSTLQLLLPKPGNR